MLKTTSIKEVYALARFHTTISKNEVSKISSKKYLYFKKVSRNEVKLLLEANDCDIQKILSLLQEISVYYYESNINERILPLNLKKEDLDITRKMIYDLLTDDKGGYFNLIESVMSNFDDSILPAIKEEKNSYGKLTDLKNFSLIKSVLIKHIGNIFTEKLYKTLIRHYFKNPNFFIDNPNIIKEEFVLLFEELENMEKQYNDFINYVATFPEKYKVSEYAVISILINAINKIVNEGRDNSIKELYINFIDRFSEIEKRISNHDNEYIKMIK